MITGILVALALFSLLAGRLPLLPLALLSAAGGLALALLSRHHSHGPVVIDQLAHRSALGQASTGWKALVCCLLLVMALNIRHPAAALLLGLMAAVFTILGAGVPLGEYLALLSLPLSFLLLSGLALLWGYGTAPTGMLSVPFGGGFLVVTAEAQTRAALVTARSVGALSCLYLLALTTPLSRLVSLLRRLRMPEVLLQLMILIYRYLFLLLELHRTMEDAAASRLGYAAFPQAVRTTGKVWGGLLFRSLHRTRQYFDAMESRCYDGRLEFLERPLPLRGRDLVWGLGLLLTGLALMVFSWR